MVYISAGPLAHYFNRWVESGRSADAVRGPHGAYWLMRYGARRRFQAVLPCVVFGLACCGVAAAELAGCHFDLAIRLGYAFFIFPVFLVACWRAVRVCCSTVRLGDTDITIRAWPFGGNTLGWPKVCSVRYSQLRTAFILEDSAGRGIGIPAEMDGVRTLCDFLIRLVEPTAIDPSVPKRMVDLL